MSEPVFFNDNPFGTFGTSGDSEGFDGELSISFNGNFLGLESIYSPAPLLLETVGTL